MFEDKLLPEQIAGIKYNVYCRQYGENSGSPEVFTSLVEAIQYQYKHLKESTNCGYVIEVSYEVRL